MKEIINKLKGSLKAEVLNELKSVGDNFNINTNLRVAHFLAQCAHESGNFSRDIENLNYSADGLNKIFGSRYFPGDPNVVSERDLIANVDSTEYARQQREIGSRVYGGRMGNAGELSKEGFKYRGRGFIQLTGKSNYEKFNEYVPENIVDNPDLVASKYPLLSAAWFWSQRNINRYADKGATSDHVESVTKRVNGGTIGLTDRIEKFNRFWEILTGEEVQLPGPSEDEDDLVLPEERSDTDNDNVSDKDTEETAQLPTVKGLKNFFKPTLETKKISYNLPGDNTEVKRESIQNVGYDPFLWYYSYQFDSIVSMNLESKSLLPTCKVIFNDQLNFISDKAYPLDNTIFTIFLNSRTPSLKSIKMDFKILKHRKLDDNSHMFEGICNIDEMFVEEDKSYPNSTSFKCLKDYAKNIGLGFNSNINDSSDPMTWICPNGMSGKEFIKSVIDKSYSSDKSFMWAYIDFYYNLNYIDIQEALEIDISDQIGVKNTGLEKINKLESLGEETQELILTNDHSMSESNTYFTKWKITNRSTETSLRMGYKQKVEFYDLLKKNYSIFDIDSQVTDGKVVLKSAPQDMDFYKKNVRSKWTGRLDRDNQHENYNYSPIQNQLNIEEVQKIGISITLNKPNYNLFRFQKINILFSNNVATPTASHLNKRLSGEWLIIDISFTYNLDEGLKERISLVRRDLSLTPEELNSENNSEAFSSNTEESNIEENNDINDDINDNDNDNDIITEESEEVEEDDEFSYDLEFSNSVEADEFFNNYNDNNDGYNGFLTGNGFNPINKDFYSSIWNTNLYDRKFNIVEFLTINSIFYLLTPKFRNNNTILEDNRRLDEIFKSNNTLSVNRTALDNFNDNSFIDKNLNKVYADILSNTNDQLWAGIDYPNNFKLEKANNDFILNSDFYKFRQKGLLKFRGRKDYENIIKYIQTYNGDNEIILKYKNEWSTIPVNKIATISSYKDWDEILKINEIQIQGVKNTFNQLKDINNIPTKNRNVSKIQNSIKNFGKLVKGSLEKFQRPDNLEDILLEMVKKQIDLLEKRS